MRLEHIGCWRDHRHGMDCWILFRCTQSSRLSFVGLLYLWGTARLFAWAKPVWLYRSCLVFQALSAWAADKWAREVGIKAPWSLITGVLLGFPA